MSAPGLMFLLSELIWTGQDGLILNCSCALFHFVHSGTAESFFDLQSKWPDTFLFHILKVT